MEREPRRKHIDQPRIEGRHKIEQTLAENNLREITRLRTLVAQQLQNALEKANDKGAQYLLAVKPAPRVERYTENEWERIYQDRMKKKHRAEVERVFKESLARKERGIERVLIFSDTQIPNQDKGLFKAMFAFIKDFKPDLIVLNGDILDVTTLSTHDFPTKLGYDFNDEIKIGNKFLDDLQKVAGKANPEVRYVFRGGNHEARVEKYLEKNASRLIGLKNNEDEDVVSIPSLLRLKERGIAWIPYMGDKQELPGGVLLHHGTRSSKNSGYTAMGYINDLGASSVTGHTHRLGLVFKTLFDRVIFGMELGSTCETKHKSEYTKDPNWQKGFGVIMVDQKTKTAYPTVIPYIGGKFQFGGKFYRG